MSDKEEFSWGVTWMVVTGASRGLGAAICEGMASLLGAGSKILGIARSAEGLQETAQKVQQANPDIKVSSTDQYSVGHDTLYGT